MSLAVSLFKWLQGAKFYQQLHVNALDGVPRREKSLWWDVGCGPGLLTRLAAEKGYHAVGYDLNKAMVGAARELAFEFASTARFETADALRMPKDSADVVSASSLLAVLPDRAAAIASLWSLVHPGGFLLIIEPGKAMNLRNALRALIKKNVEPHRALALLLWAFMRKGRSTTTELQTWRPSDLKHSEHRTGLAGMVEIWILEKKVA